MHKQPPEVFYKKGVLKKKYLYESLFFNKVAGPRLATIFKMRLAQAFSRDIVKILRTPCYRIPPGDCFYICAHEWFYFLIARSIVTL